MMIRVTITLAAVALTTVLAREFMTHVVQQAGA
jgi:hypothetical protein